MEIHWSSEDPAGNFTITFEPVFSSVVFRGRILDERSIKIFKNTNYSHKIEMSTMISWLTCR